MTLVEQAPVELVTLPAASASSAAGSLPYVIYVGRQTATALRGVRRSLTHVAEIIAGEGTDPAQVPWWEIRRDHATLIKARLMQTTLASTTINHRLACLRGVLNECRLAGLVGADDLSNALGALRTIPTVRDPAGRHVEQGELAALFAYLAGGQGPGGRRDAALLAVLTAAGPRRAEIVASQLSDWQAELRMIEFPRTKGRKPRKVPLPSGTCAALEDWVEVRGDWEGPLFPAVSQRGNVQTAAISPGAVPAMLARRIARAGIQPFTTHDLRRTLIGNLLDAGVDLATVQRFIGHSDPKTTARYDRRTERALRDAADTLHVPYVRPKP